MPQFEPAEIPPEIQAHMQAIARREGEIMETSRRLAVYWSPFSCSCRPWFTWSDFDNPPQSGCPVHGAVFIAPDGRVL